MNEVVMERIREAYWNLRGLLIAAIVYLRGARRCTYCGRWAEPPCIKRGMPFCADDHYEKWIRTELPTDRDIAKRARESGA